MTKSPSAYSLCRPEEARTQENIIKTMVLYTNTSKTVRGSCHGTQKTYLGRRVSGRAKKRADVGMVDPTPFIREGIDRLISGKSDIQGMEFPYHMLWNGDLPFPLGGKGRSGHARNRLHSSATAKGKVRISSAPIIKLRR